MGAAEASAQAIPPDEYEARRRTLLSRFTDGIVLLHARSTAADLTDHGFKQDAAFFYFSGLAHQEAAVLALDGTTGQEILFVPEPPRSFGMSVDGVGLVPGATTSFDEVQHWRELVPFLRKRLASEARKLYLDEARRPVAPGNPDGMLPMAGERNLWWRSVSEALPDAELVSAALVIREMRWKKSAAEIAALREVARASSAALLTGMRAVDPGVRQRVTEAAVVAGCIEAGAEGPSFWPWTMSGPNAHAATLVRSFYDYEHLNRAMRHGELVRMDIGCDWYHYEGDVGRTVPVSGSFSAAQAEAWDLLITAYRAGLASIRAGVSRSTLAEASREAARGRAPSLTSEHARELARLMVDSEDDAWHVHGVGLEAGEERMSVLVDGAVIAYEPGFSVGEHAYYLEDMILVTATGHEILTKGLPYTAEEISEAMSGRR